MRLNHLCLPGVVSYRRADEIQQRAVRSFLDYKASPSTTPPDPAIITSQFKPAYTCGRREIGTVSEEQREFLRAGGKAEFHEALRGGQTTFHGPGQLIATCTRYGIAAMTTEHTGVWTTPEKKIAAIGVHLRRNITSHGIALNVDTDLRWFSRIVACGLEGKKTTTFAEEAVRGKSVEEVGKTFVDEFAGRIGASEVTLASMI